MAHNLDINNGTASFAAARVDAWHQLGVTLPDAFTAEEAMEHAHLGGWNVRKLPVFARTEDGSEITVDGRFAVVRNNPVIAGQVDSFGTVGNAYHVIQNEEHAAFLNTLVDESGAVFDTAGALDGGRKVFITMKLPGYMSVGGADKVDAYIAAVNSHDGSSSFTLMVTPVRVVCQNTLNFALGAAQSKFRIRHSVGATSQIQEAREKLELTFNYLDEFNAEAKRMLDISMTESQFDEIVEREFGAPEGASQATVTRAENRLDEMKMLFAEANTQAPIAHTAWAGANALAEWWDHFAPTRGGDPVDTRAFNAVMDYAGFKTKALALMGGAAA